MSRRAATTRAAAVGPALRSWVQSACVPGGDFPIQNLPFGVFRRGPRDPARIGTAIGDRVLDVAACVEARIVEGISPETACALSAPSLNAFLAQGPASWSAARKALTGLLAADSATLRDDAALRSRCLIAAADAELLLPATIGDYSDFYASIHHATNVGSMFRPDQPLFPNYRHLPIGYHGRASSIIPSGMPVRRPQGQTKADTAELPAFGPSRLLDYELELGFFVGPGNDLGRRITMDEARDHVFGMVIVNDWSARDVQKWEYQPLGPFLAKNFATTISPWVVTMEALQPFRRPGPPRGAGEPPMLDYLKPVRDGAYDITVEVLLSSQIMRDKGQEPILVSRGTFADMYWTIEQMLVHHTSTGCNLRPGDLLATGTISGPAEDSRGCLLERTWRGRDPLQLPDGTTRTFLADGDEVTMRAWCERPGHPRIGFGDCRGVILPAA